MGRVVSFQANTTAVLTWTVDQNSTIVGLDSTIPCLITRDQNQTIANIQTPTGKIVDFNMIGSTISSAKHVQIPKVPVYAGEAIYASFSAAGSAHLYLDDPLT